MLISALGLIVMMSLAWAMSSHKEKIQWRVVAGGLGIQLLLGLLILKTDLGQWFFVGAREFVAKLISFSDKGAEFVFGEDFQDHFYAFSVVPTIIFVSALMSLLFH
mgnify:CR=1 FL=1